MARRCTRSHRRSRAVAASFSRLLNRPAQRKRRLGLVTRRLHLGLALVTRNRGACSAARGGGPQSGRGPSFLDRGASEIFKPRVALPYWPLASRAPHCAAGRPVRLRRLRRTGISLTPRASARESYALVVLLPLAERQDRAGRRLPAVHAPERLFAWRSSPVIQRPRAIHDGLTLRATETEIEQEQECRRGCCRHLSRRYHDACCGPAIDRCERSSDGR